MAEVTKGDLMFFQNEILGDMKKLDIKINNKIDSSIEELKTKINESHNQNTILNAKLVEILTLINTNNDKNQEIEKLIKFKSKMEDLTETINSKTEKLKKEIEDTNFKYDKILDFNLTLPGIIGTEKSKYKSLRDFLDYLNKTIHSLNTSKDKNNIDLKSYKDKLETLIKSFSLQIDNVTNKFKQFCNQSVKHCEEQFTKRIEETEEKVQTLRIENNKHVQDLLNESDNLKKKQNELDEFKIYLEKSYKENLKKQDELYNNLYIRYDEIENEFNLIKNKFSELSEFIKNVRFRKNIGDTVSIQEFREMSKKMDLMRKQNLKDDFYNVPDFLIADDEVIKNYYMRKNLQNNFHINQIKSNQKLKFHVESQVKKYIESGTKKKINHKNSRNYFFDNENIEENFNDNDNQKKKKKILQEIQDNKTYDNFNFQINNDIIHMIKGNNNNNNNDNENNNYIYNKKNENNFQVNEIKSERNLIKINNVNKIEINDNNNSNNNRAKSEKKEKKNNLYIKNDNEIQKKENYIINHNEKKNEKNNIESKITNIEFKNITNNKKNTNNNHYVTKYDIVKKNDYNNNYYNYKNYNINKNNIDNNINNKDIQINKNGGNVEIKNEGNYIKNIKEDNKIVNNNIIDENYITNNIENEEEEEEEEYEEYEEEEQNENKYNYNEDNKINNKNNDNIKSDEYLGNKNKFNSEKHLNLLPISNDIKHNTQRYFNNNDIQNTNINNIYKRINNNLFNSNNIINNNKNNNNEEEVKPKKNIIKKKDLTFSDLNNLVNNENNNKQNIKIDKNINPDYNNINYTQKIYQNIKNRKLRKLFNSNDNKITKKTNNSNFNILNSNKLYISESFNSFEKRPKEINENKIINNENKKLNEIPKIKQNQTTNQIQEVKRFLNTNRNQRKVNKTDINISNHLNKTSYNKQNFQICNLIQNNNLEYNQENINQKEINELVNNLSPDIKNNENNILIYGNNNKILYQNLFNINNNINQLAKLIEGTQIKCDLLEEKTNKKLFELNEQLKSIFLKISNKEKNFVFHYEKKELNSFPFNQTNNNPSKKELNKSNNNTKIRLMIENNFYENNKGNHFAALSLNGETKSNH